MKLLAALAAVLLFAAGAQAAGLHTYDGPASDVAQNQYIVVFQKHIRPAQKLAFMNSFGVQSLGQVQNEWNINDGEFQAVHVAEVDTNTILAISENPAVQYVEPVRDMHIYGTTFTKDDACNKVKSTSWGLSRTVHPGSLPTDRPISSVEYQWDDQACGAGVDLYILDTGIQITHKDFGGRARWGRDFTGEGENDRHGHGTHVAGTAGGSIHGLARCSNIVAVKVCNGGGSCPTNAILSGVQFTADAARSGGRKVVGNMSLGGGFSQASNDAVNAAVNAGAVMAVAAGNSNAPSCRYSPASAENAFTAMSTDDGDNRSSFSNYDECSNIFAPGSSITSAWIGADDATRSISGTSMASPHVAGVSAKFWSKNPSLKPAQVREQLVNRGTKNVIKNAGSGSPNVLLHMNCNL